MTSIAAIDKIITWIRLAANTHVNIYLPFYIHIFVWKIFVSTINICRSYNSPVLCLEFCGLAVSIRIPYFCQYWNTWMGEQGWNICLPVFFRFPWTFRKCSFNTFGDPRYYSMIYLWRCQKIEQCWTSNYWFWSLIFPLFNLCPCLPVGVVRGSDNIGRKGGRGHMWSVFPSTITPVP